MAILCLSSTAPTGWRIPAAPRKGRVLSTTTAEITARSQLWQTIGRSPGKVGRSDGCHVSIVEQIYLTTGAAIVSAFSADISTAPSSPAMAPSKRSPSPSGSSQRVWPFDNRSPKKVKQSRATGEFAMIEANYGFDVREVDGSDALG